MNASTFGEPHSLRRYIAFGIVGGVLASIIATVFGVSLPLVITLAAGVAGALGGREWESSSLRGARNIPTFAIIAVVIVVVGFAVSKCGRVMVPKHATTIGAVEIG